MRAKVGRATVIGVFGICLSLAACGEAGSNGGAASIGEDDLACAGLVYAANSLTSEGRFAADKDVISDNYMSAVTIYGTRHAEAAKLDSGLDAFNLAKIQGMRMLGKMPSP
jgi:hypothetical protein